MRVLFIYSDIAITNQRRFQHGIAYLSGALRSDGVETGLIHIYEKPQKDIFLDRIRAFNPDVLAYSSLTNQYPMLKTLAGWSQRLGIMTIYGGIHPSTAPAACIHTPGIDAICVGEGDLAIRDFISVFKRGGDITKVDNFRVKGRDDRISVNPIRPLVEDLDLLPFPDYDLFPYENTDDYRVSRSITVQASRGCVYSCAYCCNHYLRSLYPNKEQYMRLRSVTNIIAELKFLLSKYPSARLVRFTDDALSSDKVWFREFCARYRREIGLPYSVNDHPHNITPEVAALYKESRCSAVSMGIENGNADLREKIMKRPFSNDEIIHAFQLIRNAGIDAASFNIVGSPYETGATLLDTIKLNARCRPRRYTNAYFQPFCQTAAARMCHEAGWAVKEIPGSFFEEPVVALPHTSREQLIFYFKYFGILVGWYKLLYAALGTKRAGIFDKILRSSRMPYRVFNAVMMTRMDIKKRFPGLTRYLISVKRFVFKLSY